MPQGEVKLKSYGASPGNHATAPPDTDVVINLPAPGRQEIMGVCWSYSAAPTGGRLTIAGGGFNFDIDITAAGHGSIPFPQPVHATDDVNIVITLYAGGAGVVGKLNILGRGAA